MNSKSFLQVLSIAIFILGVLPFIWKSLWYTEPWYWSVVKIIVGAWGFWVAKSEK